MSDEECGEVARCQPDCPAMSLLCTCEHPRSHHGDGGSAECRSCHCKLFTLSLAEIIPSHVGSSAIAISLPPEPPRDRVVEAVDQVGSVVERWKWDGEFWLGDSERRISWDEILRHAARWKAMDRGWSLRHVSAGEVT